MRGTLKKLSKTPTQLELREPRGDFLADVLGASLIRHALYTPIEARAPWGVSIGRQSRAPFYLVVQGSARLEVEGEKPHVLSPGEVGFVPHGAPHVLRDAVTSRAVAVCDGRYCARNEPRRIGGDGAATSIIAGFFELSESQGASFLAKVPRLIVLSAKDPTWGPWVASAVQFIVAESATSHPAGGVVIQRLADVLFILAVRSVAALGLCQSSGLGAVVDPRIYEALNLMHARVAEAWTVESIARQVGMSRSGFAGRFSEIVGEPPLQYLARWRVTRAAELLRTTSDKVETIAQKVGYESVPAFSRVFKRLHGIAPGAFRRTASSLPDVPPRRVPTAKTSQPYPK